MKEYHIQSNCRCLLLSELSSSRTNQHSNLPPGLRYVLDCVCFPTAYAAVAIKLFKSWVIADTYNHAVLLQSDDRFRSTHCVTLDGVILFASGEVRSAPSK